MRKMLKSKRAIFFLKALLSIWILYHLFVVIIMSNGGSFMGRLFQRAVTPYANATGFNASWNFFSPDPAHTMYLRYQVYFNNENGEELKEPLEAFFPALKNLGTFDPTQRRELYMMHYLILNPERLEKMLVPYICKTNPEASSIRIDFVVESIAPLDQAAILKQESMAELSKHQDYLKKEFPCHVE